MLNSTSLIGRLGRDPELRHSPSGEAIAGFSLAFEQYNKETGWVNVVCFKQTAEAVAAHLHRGDECAVSGRLSFRSWEQDGAKRTTLEIAANDVTFLRKKGEARGEAAPAPQAAPAASAGAGDSLDPFGEE